MTVWNELNAADRPAGLPLAERREIAPGIFRFCFEHAGQMVADPTRDLQGQLPVSPREYRFAIRGFHGGKTAWARDFANGMLLAVNPDGQSHVLTARHPARLLFIDQQGQVLQDTAQQPASAERAVEQPLDVRLTLQISLDLRGDGQEQARAALLRALTEALQERADLPGTQARITDVQIEQAAVLDERTGRSSDTDFSQLLDL